MCLSHFGRELSLIELNGNPFRPSAMPGTVLFNHARCIKVKEQGGTVRVQVNFSDTGRARRDPIHVWV